MRKFTTAQIKRAQRVLRTKISTHIQWGRPVQAAEARRDYELLKAAMYRSTADDMLTAAGIPLDDWENAVSHLVKL